MADLDATERKASQLRDSYEQILNCGELTGTKGKPSEFFLEDMVKIAYATCWSIAGGMHTRKAFEVASDDRLFDYEGEQAAYIRFQTAELLCSDSDGEICLVHEQHNS